MSLRKVNVPPTSARKETNAQAIRILEILQQDEDFYRRLGIGGILRTMTAKQFIIIINYCHEIICGYPLETIAKGDATNEIIEFLKKIDCPFTINKSLFKSPTAPHTFEQSITLLHWLVDFIPLKSNSNGMLKMLDAQCNLYKQDNQFPSDAYTRVFHEKAANAFQHWGINSEVYKEITDALIDGFLEHHTNGQCISQGALLQRTKDLQDEIVELNKFNRTIKNEKEFQTAESQALQLESDASDKKNELEAKTDEYNALKLEFDAKKYKIDILDRDIEEIKNTIQTQQYNVDQMGELRRKYYEIKHRFELEEKLIIDIKDNQNEKIIQTARLKQNIAEADLKLENCLNEFVRNMDETQISKSNYMIKLKELMLRKPLSVAEIKNALEKLVLLADTHDLKVEEQMQNMKINEAKSKVEMLQLKTTNMQTDIHDKIKSLNYLNTRLEEERLSGEFNVAQIKTSINDMRREMCVLEKEILDRRVFCQKLDECNEAIGQSIDEFTKYSSAMWKSVISKGDKICDALLNLQSCENVSAAEFRRVAAIVVKAFSNESNATIAQINEKAKGNQELCNRFKNELVEVPAGNSSIVFGDVITDE